MVIQQILTGIDIMFERYEVQHPEIDCVECPRVVVITDEYEEEHILCRGLLYHDPVDGNILPLKEARPIKMKSDKIWECDPYLPSEEWMPDNIEVIKPILNISSVLKRLFNR